MHQLVSIHETMISTKYGIDAQVCGHARVSAESILE